VELLSQYEQLAAAHSSLDPAPAPSHNDLFKPDNMLFDGNSLRMVDWEAAFQNDRYADLAVVANTLVANETEEETYLQEYFGAPPNSYQAARFYLMRQLAHMFYTLVFLSLGSDGKPIDWSEPVPAYSDFQRRFWAHEIDWRTIIRKQLTAGFIGSSSGTTCASQDSRKRWGSSQTDTSSPSPGRVTAKQELRLGKEHYRPMARRPQVDEA
jgi:Phosphotransferase enzyme family